MSNGSVDVSRAIVNAKFAFASGDSAIIAA